MEVVPMTDIFSLVDLQVIMMEYSKFLQVVVSATDKVHLCSKAVLTKFKQMISLSEFYHFYAAHPHQFFSLSEYDVYTCSHPEMMLNRRFWNWSMIEFIKECDIIYTKIRGGKFNVQSNSRK